MSKVQYFMIIKTGYFYRKWDRYGWNMSCGSLLSHWHHHAHPLWSWSFQQCDWTVHLSPVPSGLLLPPGSRQLPGHTLWPRLLLSSRHHLSHSVPLPSGHLLQSDHGHHSVWLPALPRGRVLCHTWTKYTHWKMQSRYTYMKQNCFYSNKELSVYWFYNNLMVLWQPISLISSYGMQFDLYNRILLHQ